MLLWTPVLFEEVDTVTSWFVRGVAWTVCFELVLLALIPFERALWETSRGARISRRMGGAASRLHSGSHRSRMGRLSAIATVALAVPVALLVRGLNEQPPAHAGVKPVSPIKVVRVTKVVRPMTVKTIVQRAPASVAQPVATPRQQAVSAPPAPRGTENPEPKAVVPPSAPLRRETAPKAQPEAAPPSVQGCEGDACGSSAAPSA